MRRTGYQYLFAGRDHHGVHQHHRRVGYVGADGLHPPVLLRQRGLYVHRRLHRRHFDGEVQRELPAGHYLRRSVRGLHRFSAGFHHPAAEGRLFPYHLPWLRRVRPCAVQLHEEHHRRLCGLSRHPRVFQRAVQPCVRGAGVFRGVALHPLQVRPEPDVHPWKTRWRPRPWASTPSGSSG